MKSFWVSDVFLMTKAGLVPLEDLKPRLLEPKADDEVFVFDGSVDATLTFTLTPKQSELFANFLGHTFEDAPEGSLPELN